MARVNSIQEHHRFTLRPEVIIEDFSSVSLAFLAEQLRVVQLNRTAKLCLSLLLKGYSVSQVAGEMHRMAQGDYDSIFQDIKDVLWSMERNGIILRDVILTRGELFVSEEKEYMCNPDVSCRIEDDDGAILFNPDTNAVQVINPVGLLIWQSLSRPGKLSDVVQDVLDACEGASPEAIETDAREFIEQLVEKGFIGEVVHSDAM